MTLPLCLEMTTTLADFRRLLPAAVGHAPFVEKNRAFEHREGGRGWRIHVSPLPQLRLGLIELERHQVEFEFEGYSPRETADFMARFDLYFRRGGG